MYHHDRDYDGGGDRRKFEPRRGETSERFERGGGFRGRGDDYDSDPRSRLKTNDRWRDRDDDRDGRGSMMSSRGGRGGGRGGKIIEGSD